MMTNKLRRTTRTTGQRNMRNKFKCRQLWTVQNQNSPERRPEKFDASLAEKTLTATETSNLDMKELIMKLVDVAETVDIDFSTILTEKTKDPVYGTVRSWLRKGIPPEAQSPEF